MTQRFAYSLILFAAILWGISGLLTKATISLGLSPLETAFWRLGFAGILFALHARRQQELKLKARSDLWALCGFGLVAIAMHYVGFNLAVEHGGVSLVFLILSCVPVLVAIASSLFLKEKLTPWKGLLVALSVVGLVLVSRGNAQGVVVNGHSLGCCFIAAISGVIYTVASKGLLQRYSVVSLNAFAMPIAALALLPFVSFSQKSPMAWGLLVVLTVFPTYLAHLWFQLGLTRVEATQAALLVNVKAVTALGTAAMFLGERFTLVGLIGAGLILLVMALTVLPQHLHFSLARERSLPYGTVRAQRVL